MRSDNNFWPDDEFFVNRKYAGDFLDMFEIAADMIASGEYRYSSDILDEVRKTRFAVKHGNDFIDTINGDNIDFGPWKKPDAPRYELYRPMISAIEDYFNGKGRKAIASWFNIRGNLFEKGTVKLNDLVDILEYVEDYTA